MLRRTAVMGSTVIAALAVLAPPAHAGDGVLLYKTQYDSPGTDTGSNSSLNTGYMALRNDNTATSVDLEGWTLRDAAGHTYTFGDVTLAPGKNLYVHTGSGSGDGHDVYWGSSSYIWNNSGDTATLRNSSGKTIDSCKWPSGTEPTYC